MLLRPKYSANFRCNLKLNNVEISQSSTLAWIFLVNLYLKDNSPFETDYTISRALDKFSFSNITRNSKH